METTIVYEDLLAWLEQHVAELLERSPDSIDPDVTFADQGMSSLKAVQLTADLEDHLGIAVTPTLAYEYPTIRSMAEHLSATRSSA